MGDPEEALKDFQACLDIDQGNKAARNQVIICQTKIKANKQKQKQLYGGMFDKFAKIDRAVSSIDYESSPMSPYHSIYNLSLNLTRAMFD